MSVKPLVAALAAAALAVGLGAPSAGAASKYDPKPVGSGAGWLTGELTGGLVHNAQFDFDDYGLSIDVALGLHAAGKKAKVVKQITKKVAKNVDFYTTAGPATTYAGATAKALVLAAEQGKNPRSFGGADLVSRLEGRVATAAPITGRIEDSFDPADPYGGDYANVVGQTYAAAGLSLVKSPKAASAVSFLLQQQCDQGYFRQYFTLDKTRPDQSCQGAPRKERAASTDATALAVLALHDVKGGKAKAAVKKAVAWLLETQRPEGPFSDTGKSSGAFNANSTGLAGWALGESGEVKRAARAAAWIRNLQVPATNPCAGKLASQAGAVAYDATAYPKGQKNGIKKKDSDQWRRASAQALPALRWAPKAEGDFTASGPRTAKVDAVFAIHVTGVAPGERVCVSDAGTTYEFNSGPHAIKQVAFAVSDPGSHTFKVWAGSKSRDVVVRVTG
jgi:hypothetical protein